MQILTSGSFINLENQEKIEQLVFTAKEIAGAAVSTDGFTSSEDNNKRLALEIWRGAEYMTREYEEARIQNIFVSNFLDRLREIAPAQDGLPKNSVATPEEIPAIETEIAKDEFLGFFTAGTGNENQEINEFGNEATAIIEATNSAETLPRNVETAASVQTESLETETVESAETTTAATTEIETTEPEIVEPVAPKQESENKITEVSQTANDEKSATGAAITLSDKEPYRWDDCTVTATIQLLPVETGIRRAVVSVRTHDFAPQISVTELAGAATPEHILPALERAFEKYKTDLPVKVMDKMKREKSAGKKRAANTTVEAKPNSSATKPSAASAPAKPETKSANANVAKPENNKSATTAATSTATSAAPQAMSVSRSKPSVKTNKPVDSAQGNLFGF